MSDRGEFEAWARDYMMADIERRDDGEYVMASTSELWQAWQTARRWRPIGESPKVSAKGFIACRQGQPNSAMHVIAVDGDLLTMAGMTTYRDATHWIPLPEPPNE